MLGKLKLIRYAKRFKLFINTCSVYVPQRYGWIAWGLKLIIDCLIIALEYFSILDRFFIVCASTGFCSIYISNIIFKFILYTIFVIDFSLTMIYTIGRYMKNVKLLKMAYYYYLVVWVFMVLFMAVIFGIVMVYVLRGFYPSCGWISFAVKFFYFFVNIGIQTYNVVFLRSEIIKLNSSCELRLLNNEADDECTMAREDDVTCEENGI